MQIKSPRKSMKLACNSSSIFPRTLKPSTESGCVKGLYGNLGFRHEVVRKVNLPSRGCFPTSGAVENDPVWFDDVKYRYLVSGLSFRILTTLVKSVSFDSDGITSTKCVVVTAGSSRAYHTVTGQCSNLGSRTRSFAELGPTYPM